VGCLDGSLLAEAILLIRRTDSRGEEGKKETRREAAATSQVREGGQTWRCRDVDRVPMHGGVRRQS
jgi:hypothetical protein